MKILSICALILITLTASGQNSGKDKAQADALVASWNSGFNSDNPKSIEKILTGTVTMMSGEEYYQGRDSVMGKFVTKRMPVISDLNAVNEYFSVSKDMIYTAGKYTLTVSRKDGTTGSAIGNYTFAWVRQPDNSFKIDFMHLESIPR